MALGEILSFNYWIKLNNLIQQLRNRASFKGMYKALGIEFLVLSNARIPVQYYQSRPTKRGYIILGTICIPCSLVGYGLVGSKWYPRTQHK